MPDQLPVVVVGAGIAGLTLSLCLARAGVQVTLLEKVERLREVGAGLQLSPNASSILIDLGLGPALDATGVRPEAVVIRDSASSEVVTRMPLGGLMMDRYGAPYIVIHRADLQATLRDAVMNEPRVALHLGAEITSIRQFKDSVEVQAISDGKPVSFTGSVLVGADGVRSMVRQKVLAGGPAVYTGRTAWRATFRASDWHGSLDLRKETGLWMGSRAHLVHYAIDAGREINLIAAVDDDWIEDDWDVPGSKLQIAQAFRDWPEQVRELIDKPDVWRKWALCGAPPHTPWLRERAVLIGDAVHGMLPFVAQGGAMAIEDARVLASLLSADDDRTIEERLDTFVSLRKPRTDKVMAMARRNGSIYHLDGLSAKARNMVMRLAGPERLLDALDWIYGWTPVES
jgi:salicylate hydroxylase